MPKTITYYAAVYLYRGDTAALLSRHMDMDLAKQAASVANTKAHDLKIEGEYRAIAEERTVTI